MAVLSLETGNWIHDINLGILPAGTFYFDISGLTDSAPYYCRCDAVNSASISWADSSATFTAVNASTSNPDFDGDGTTDIAIYLP